MPDTTETRDLVAELRDLQRNVNAQGERHGFKPKTLWGKAADEIDRLSRELLEAKEALKPFANMAGFIPPDRVFVRVRASDEVDFKIMGRDLERARSVLSPKKDSETEGHG